MPGGSTLVVVGDADASTSSSLPRKRRLPAWEMRVGGLLVNRHGGLEAAAARPRTPAGRRPASRRGTVGAENWPRLRVAGYAGLSRPRAAEHDSRRAVRQPREPESAPGQGLHLRRAHRVRSAARPRSVRAADERPDRGHGRGHTRVAAGARRSSRACVRPRPTKSRSRVRRLPEGIRAASRPRSRWRAGSRSWRSTACPTRYFEEFVPRVEAVTEADVSRVAPQYLDPARMVTLVGRRSRPHRADAGSVESW